jgi:hypothetical protein
MERKIYTKPSEKVIDFLIGFLLLPLLVVLINAFSYRLWGFMKIIRIGYFHPIPLFGSTILGLAELALAIYLCIKRKYIGIGLLFTLVVIPLVLLGTCLLILAGMNLFKPFWR